MRRNIVLLVEDRDDDVQLTLRAFAKAQLAGEVVVARDGEEALDYLFATGAHAGRDPGAFPEVVLLDLQLPKLDGLEVLRRIRAHDRTRRLPVVILTSSVADEDLAASYDLGASSFVQKPVEFERFVIAARQLGLYWLELNEPAPEPDGRSG